jgi:methylisocitrate lyase
MTLYSAGAAFRKAVQEESPLQVVGAINANHALLAKRAGFKAIYLSGGGVAAGSLGLPDLGISNLDDVLTDVRRITDVCDLPLLVDVDTGFGASAFNVARTVKSMIKFGAAAMHIEDQVGAKRCGHRPGKEIVSKQEMVDRIKAAVDARTDDNFVIMARTDALAVEGLDAAIERAVACVEAGADMIFPEAMITLDMYKQFAAAVKVPVLANITEFGATPLFTVDELRSADVGLVLYPLSAFRAMNKAAENVYGAIRRDGTQKNVVDTMQTRAELYERIDYHDFEQKLTRCSPHRRNKSRKTQHWRNEMTEATFKPKNPSPCPASPPATPRCAPSAAPATTCTIAATTSWTWPTPASSRKSPTCWCTASCRPWPNWPATRPS